MPERKTAGYGRAGQQLNLRATKDEHRRWKAAAKRAGLSLSAWIRLAANYAEREERHYLEARERADGGEA